MVGDGMIVIPGSDVVLLRKCGADKVNLKQMVNWRKMNRIRNMFFVGGDMSLS